MNPTKLLVQSLIAQLIMRICSAEMIIESSKSRNSSELLVQATIKLIETCYETEPNTIGISGNLSNSLITALSNGEFPVSIVLINESTRIVNDGQVSRMSRHKLQLFVIVILSSLELKRHLIEIKMSRWWNHMANFYIVDWSTNDDGCSGAYEILSTAWRMNLLEVKFTCIDEKSRIMIYSFNPYTSVAPRPWKLKKIHRAKNNHPWSLLMREYHDDLNVCDHMDFDRTKDLGGYAIRITLWQNSLIHANINETGIDSIVGLFGHLVRKFFSVLNATVQESVHDVDEIMGEIDDDGNASGILAEIVNGTTDIGFIQLTMQKMANAKSTYPIMKAGLLAMTQYRGYVSQLSKFGSVFDYSSTIGICLVLVVMVIFMKFFMGHNLSNALLETIRLISYSCLVKLPISVASRIILSSLFIFVITIVGIYQSQWASMLSKHIPLANVESMSDLAKSTYTIYSNRYYETYFSDKSFAGRFVGIDDWNCTDYVLREPISAACLDYSLQLIHEASRFKLHLSRHMIGDADIVYAIRDDWPLEDKINSLLQRLVVSHLYEYSQIRDLEGPLRAMEIERHKYNEGCPRVLTFDDLNFVFGILVVGSACATLCFIIEIVINKYGKWLRNFRICKLIK